MRSRIRSTMFGVAVALAAGACLEPPDEDTIPLASAFGDPDVDPTVVAHVEDTMAADRVAMFSSNVAYLRGFADGEPLWYWNVDGPNATFIAPLYQIIGRDGQRMGRPIVDALPGDAGYTPWWRVVEVHVTERYDGERIWSRDAIDAGIQLGILQEPLPTDKIVNCPVTLRGTPVPVNGNVADNKSTDWAWYRNQRFDWIVFNDLFTVPADTLSMPIYPVYVLQRINEGLPLYEFATGVDITNDGALDDSNNIFASGLDGPRYSPLWFVSFVRTTADYLSVDTSTTARVVGLSAEDQFVDPQTRKAFSGLVVGDPIDMRGALVNCPIQRVQGEL